MTKTSDPGGENFWGADYYNIDHADEQVDEHQKGYLQVLQQITQNATAHNKFATTDNRRCVKFDYEGISKWQWHDNYNCLNLVVYALPPLNEPAITYLWTTEQSINLFKLSTLTGYIRQTVVDMMNFDQLQHSLFICFATICPTCFHEFLCYKTKPLADFGIFPFVCV